MIDLNYISGFFAAPLQKNPDFAKHMVKEYIQLMVLDFLSTTPYMRKMTFIGGTNLRLIKRIDRFSEDLDFDIRDMTEEEFMAMTDDVLTYLRRNGLNAEAKDRKNPKLTAFRRNIFFPQLLFDLNLSGHKEERFLLKMEGQDQGVDYEPMTVNVSGCGFFFSLPVPPDGVLLSMKLSALLHRAKGRDFYDAMFLLEQTQPDYVFLEKRGGIGSALRLKEAIGKLLQETDLNVKKRDFEHLLFSKFKSDKILRFDEFIEANLQIP